MRWPASSLKPRRRPCRAPREGLRRQLRSSRAAKRSVVGRAGRRQRRPTRDVIARHGESTSVIARRLVDDSPDRGLRATLPWRHAAWVDPRRNKIPIGESRGIEAGQWSEIRALADRRVSGAPNQERHRLLRANALAVAFLRA